MTSRIPEPPSAFEAEGIPDPGDSSEAQLATGEAGQGYGEEPPHDHPLAADDFGTTAFEQSEGESLSGRLDRELPDDALDIRPAEDPDRSVGQLEQDTSTSPVSDSGTNRTADDIEATSDASVGGEGPEEGAMHVIDG